MEAGRTSETLVNICLTTQRNNPEDGNLHTHRPDDGGSMTSETSVNFYQTTRPWRWRQYNLWNVGKHLPDYTAQQPRRQKSSYSDDGGSMTSETLVNIGQTTQRNNPEDRNLQIYNYIKSSYVLYLGKFDIYIWFIYRLSPRYIASKNRTIDEWRLGKERKVP
jgi:hypothetical protein